MINSTFVKHGWKRVPPLRALETANSTKGSETVAVTRTKGVVVPFFRSLSLFLSFRSTRDSNLTRIHPLPPQTRSFLRSRDRSFVRSFLEPRQARLETLLVRRCTPAVGGWQFREADSANEKLVGFDIWGEGRGEREEAPRQRVVVK